MKHTYIIGEIGQNHNGSIDIAKLIMDCAVRRVGDEIHSDCKGIDAIKFTKRDLNAELSQFEMNKPYNSPHSFGKTYGEHRAVLELTDEEYLELYRYAKELDFDFIITLCAIGCLSLLKIFTPDALKVASRDLTNLPLLEGLAETKLPIILSTGMTGKKELDCALDIITKYHSKITILHCLSQYPADPQNINLQTIKYLKDHYPQYRIGYSDHSIGVVVPVVAVGMGAEVIEKHITIDRKMKGTDQEGSLGIDGIFRMVRDIRNIDMAIGEYDLYINPSVEAAKVKLERSIASKEEIKAGAEITSDNIHLLSPGDGFKWIDRGRVIGKSALRDITAHEIIYDDMIS